MTEHSVLKQLKSQLLNVVLNERPEMSVELFAMAAMHGDLETLDLIIDKVGNKLDNLEEMQMVREAVADAIKKVEAEERRLAAMAEQADQETRDLLNKFQLKD